MPQGHREIAQGYNTKSLAQTSKYSSELTVQQSYKHLIIVLEPWPWSR